MSQYLTDAQLRELLPRLRRFAYWLTRNASAADDLVQNTLERALRKAHSKRPETQWQAWMFRILYRQFLDSQRWAKRYARLLALFGEQAQTETDNSPEAQWMAQSTLEAFGTLKPEQRALLLLVTVEGFSYQQASEALDIPLGTVMSRLSRARQALRQLEEGSAPSIALRKHQ